MATNKRLGKKLPDWVRREDTAGVRIDSGPYIGLVKNNRDPARGGRLQVWIPDLGGDENNPKNWRTVGYASPFTGTTYQPSGANSAKNNRFDQVAHSYGMWAVPPDIGNQVICTFIAGDPNRGYWFACVNPSLTHYMLPAMAAGNFVDTEQLLNPALKSKYDSNASFWPVVEFNENLESNFGTGYINNPKPPHEHQVGILIDQGLDRDPIRGAIGSSSQRESPSQVFGISTPGRAINDTAQDPAYQEKLRAGTLTDADTAVRARKGGHSFVMDDGDVNGAHQLLRLRTAGGHQILMNDTEHVMYIANSDGSTWMEFTGGGHINVYSSSGINMRTEGDFNIHADRDFNVNAGGNIRIKGNTISNQSSAHTIKTSNSFSVDSGAISLLSKGAIGLEGASGSFKTSGDLVFKGGKIQLNSVTPTALTPITEMKTYKQNDVSWDTTKAVYVNKAEVFESISTITPTHEPWNREVTSGLLYPPVNDLFTPPVKETKQSSVCEPQVPASGNARSVQVFGSTNEAMLESALVNYGISDTVEFAAIMAQCSHESGGFKYVRELGADSYFAKYEGRTDLGNTQPGDGVKYKGRGFIQITGRDIYTKAGAYLGIDLVVNPQLAEDPATAAKLVLFFFFEYKKSRTTTLNWADCTAVTRLVNGGTNGLTDRQTRFDYYKGKYANGLPLVGVPSNAVSTGSGGIVVDGSGNPVTFGSNKLDPGPEFARGKPIVDAAPYVTMARDDAPVPSAISSLSGVPGLISSQVKAMMIQIGYYESTLNYDDIDSTRGMIGRYHINTLLLKEYGYTNGKDIFNSANWLGKDGMKSADDWTNTPSVQEALMEKIANDYYTKLVANGGLKTTDDVCTVSGMITTAYFFREYTAGILSGGPVDRAKTWRENANQTNKLNEGGEIPYNQGRYAVDILSLQATAAGVNPKGAAPTSGTSESGIDPMTVITFGTGSGNFEHYQKLGTAIKTSVEQMAREFKKLTGRKLAINSTYRSYDEQQSIYNAWLAAGGTPSNPSAGGYYMPAKPSATAPHARGVAFDISRADIATLNELGLLGSYNFTFPFPVNDPVHIQFKG